MRCFSDVYVCDIYVSQYMGIGARFRCLYLTGYTLYKTYKYS
jgi:hypothetical protein